jgi:hypothetical protein
VNGAGASRVVGLHRFKSALMSGQELAVIVSAAGRRDCHS